MKTINLRSSLSSDGTQLILNTSGTIWEDIDISSLAITVYGEDKTVPISSVKLEAEGLYLLTSTDVLQADIDWTIPTYHLQDDFYSIALEGITIPGDTINSTYTCIGATSNIERQFRNETLDTAFNQMYNKNNVSPSNLMLSINHVNGHLMLDHLNKLSTIAIYSTDREIAWRKINQVLYSYYGS